MALSPALKYYRGQFNPEAAYQNQRPGNEGIISMYNPEVEAQFLDAVTKRQERFDTANLAQQQERVRIGETETYDLAELNNRLKSFETNINDLVKNKYNGDYGAAANEIAKLIGTERTNPFYHFNKQKVEMSKAYLDAKMKLGANFMSTANPLDVNFKDWQNGKTFEFTPINKEDIVKAASLVGQNFAKMVTSDSGLQMSPEGQYFKNTVQYGIKDLNHLDEFIAKSGVDKQIYEAMPELSKVGNQEAVKSAIRQGLTSAIGTTDTRYMANQAYIDPIQAGKLQGGSPNLLTEVGFTEVPEDVNDIMDSSYWDVKFKDPLAIAEAKKLGIPNIKSYKDLVHAKKHSSIRFQGEEERLAKTALNNVKSQLDKTLKTDKQMFASRLYNINELAENSSQDRTLIEGHIKAINSYINNLQPNDLVGMSRKDSKKLDGLNDKKIMGFSFITTGNPNNPIQISLQLHGLKGTGTKAEVIQTNAMVNPTSIDDQQNIILFLGKLNPSILNSYLSELKANK